MRVMLLLDNYQDDDAAGGIVYRLCQRWMASPTLSLSVLAFSEEGPLRHRLEALGLGARALPASLPGDWRRFRAESQRILCSKTRPDVLHSFCSWPDLRARLFSRANGKVPLITSLIGMEICCSGKVQESIRSRMLERLTRRSADCVTVCCSVLQRELSARRINPALVRNIPMGVDGLQSFPLAENNKGRFRSLLGVEEEAPLLICAGSLNEHGDQDVLLRALPAVVERFPHVRLFFIGDGPERPRLEALITELGLRENVRLVGHLSSVLSKLFSTADVVVQPARHEAFALAAAEAMAAGTPVVVSDCSGNPELVKDGETGFVVPRGRPEGFAEAINRLLDNELLREEMGEAARDYMLEHHEIGATADAFKELWRELAPNALWTDTTSLELEEMEGFKAELEG